MRKVLRHQLVYVRDSRRSHMKCVELRLDGNQPANDEHLRQFKHRLGVWQHLQLGEHFQPAAAWLITEVSTYTLCMARSAQTYPTLSS